MNSSLSHGLQILDLLVGEQRAWRLSELAHAIGVSKSGLHALLATLVECGYVEHLPGGFYRLGLKAWRIAGALPAASLVDVAGPIMQSLVDEAGEGAILGVLDGFEVTYVHLVDGSKAVRVHAEVGDRISAHCTSTGLALLAFQTPDFVDRWIPHALARTSPRTIIAPDELRAELRRTRARGYSINRGGWHDDVGGIAFPIMGARGPIAGLCVALPLFRMTRTWIKDVAPLVKRAAADIGDGLLGRAGQQAVATARSIGTGKSQT